MWDVGQWKEYFEDLLNSIVMSRTEEAQIGAGAMMLILFVISALILPSETMTVVINKIELN